MSWIFWLLIALVVIVVFANLGKRKESATSDTLRLVVETSISSRVYDPNAYRLDGLATPQYRITYADVDGLVTEREIFVDTWQTRGSVTYYYCWCFLRDDRRTFRSDRILETINIQTGRRIRDIAAYLERY